MKVTSYVIDCVRVPTDEAITGSHLVLRLRSDDGLEGFGYVSRLRDDALKTCAALVQRYVDDAIVDVALHQDRKSTRLNSSHRCNSYAVFCLTNKTIHNCHTCSF